MLVTLHAFRSAHDHSRICSDNPVILSAESYCDYLKISLVHGTKQCPW